MLRKLNVFKKIQSQSHPMSGINVYDRQLSESDLLKNKHRDLIGGRWDEIGRLQYDFLLSKGLQSDSTLLDIGCGCLRGGIHFIKYLEAGKYYGLDVNASLIKAAQREIELARLQNKQPHLLVTDKFEIDKFQQQFDFMLSISLFTHLPMNIIIRCLSEAKKNLAPLGKYYATFFIAPTSAHIAPITHYPGGMTSYYDSDPFHYSLEEISLMAGLAGLEVNSIGSWQHPRNQKIVEFYLPNL